eukprot:CAMPEP_0115414892 /NCGR_PEP_ID=MMETSP0271-20121206/22817_1 /TAXON_ID=71861 /ORGANISM="Scrippsiella trochoidea, Strain CCMP3099" /LENGTH=722 /DNA_ID=CAMNT_0002839211 /DNA_START=78 /DNA_END=2242 /DNA_ORIENTATION=-
MTSSYMASLLLLLAVSNPVLSSVSTANPIRKVVTMLQDMQLKVTEEGKKEEELYDKFMCYCKTSGGALSASIEAGSAKIESVGAEIKSSTENLEQTKASLKEHQDSRAAANDAVSQATALREKEAAEYAKFKADHETNIDAITKAVAALEKGMSGSFLQTPAAGLVRSYAMEKAELPDSSRQELLAFLAGTQSSDYVPQGGEITGILKQMGDEMSKSLSEATAEEQAAIQNYEGLMAAKKKELSALQGQVEEEMARIGDLGVAITSMNNDLVDTQEALGEDEKFKKELEAGCDTKTKEWEEVKKTRSEELLALAETIKVLNDDDALELFKKTLPSASASLVQVKVSASLQKARALELLHAAAKKSKRPELDLIALALNGKTAGFEQIIKMIDDMVAILKKEQQGDDSKKEYCEAQFDETDDKRKGLELSISDSEKAISEMEGSIETLKEELAALEAGIKALDKSVAEATEQRKAENAEHKDLMTNNGLAKEVLGWAKNRLNKFYNPKMYKPPAKAELSSQDRIVVSMGGTLTTTLPGGIAGTNIGAAAAAASLVQIRAHSHREAPPPPPETFGPYAKKGEESSGVIAMIDLLVKDLDKEMQESEVMEKDAQADYEKMMEDAGDKRASDSKLITQKSTEKADAEEAMEAEKAKKDGTTKVHMATMEYIASLHKECDWLMQYYDARKSARTSESESLVNAKAVLSGSDYALVQTGSTGGRLTLR